MPPANLHHSSWVMLGLLLAFAVIHSGGASLRVWGVAKIGERAWRLLFAAVSIPSAVLVIGYFLAHRYDGVRLWNLQDQPWVVPLVWAGTAISFLFLYPATYNLLEIPAVLKPQVRLYATGIIRISRHPQAVGGLLETAFAGAGPQAAQLIKGDGQISRAGALRFREGVEL